MIVSISLSMLSYPSWIEVVTSTPPLYLSAGSWHWWHLVSFSSGMAMVKVWIPFSTEVNRTSLPLRKASLIWEFGAATSPTVPVSFPLLLKIFKSIINLFFLVSPINLVASFESPRSIYSCTSFIIRVVISSALFIASFMVELYCNHIVIIPRETSVQVKVIPRIANTFKVSEFLSIAISILVL